MINEETAHFSTDKTRNTFTDTQASALREALRFLLLGKEPAARRELAAEFSGEAIDSLIERMQKSIPK